MTPETGPRCTPRLVSRREIANPRDTFSGSRRYREHRGPQRPGKSPRVFATPRGLRVDIFDRDLVFAGLARVKTHDGKEVVVKTADRGRTIDIYALRHTFGTHLSKPGVPLRTAQAAKRHSDPSLTANVYSDPKLLDVAGAVASLPDLPLGKVERTIPAIATR